MRILKRAALLTSAAVLSALPAMAADSFAIINTKVVTNTQAGIIDGATVIVQDGKIQAIGKTDTSDAAPKANGTTILDGSEMWVTPGIFSSFSQTGMVEVSQESATNDTGADDAISSAALRAADGFNPNSTVVSATRAEGITHGVIAPDPGKSLLGGIGALVDMTGNMDSVDNDSAFAYAALGSYGARKSGGSRSASMSKLRSALKDASRRYGSPDDGDSVSRMDAAALAPVATGRMPLMVAADRASDIKAAMDLKTEFPKLKLIIIGGAEAWMVTDAIKAAGAKVLIDPTESLPASFDQLGTRLDNAQRLQAAGVDYAFIARTADFSHNARLLPQHAGNAVANGLPWDSAFKAITLSPARMFGRPELGSLSVGQTANLVVWDGDPLEVMSAPTRVVIEGERQSLESRQSKLASRYNPNNPDTRQYKYRR